MPLQFRTILNSRDRHRFVSERAAQPYLTDRQRKNLLRAARQAEALLRDLVQASRYGTANRLDRAYRLRCATAHVLAIEERLANYPPPAEPAHDDLNTFRLAAD